ncbi:MAG: HAMP domain-containing sensor histidine kinase [Bacteroidota bacterium]|nr:HAMP domain-containing sensor histidine kinase [Bacteroidota bacterium]
MNATSTSTLRQRSSIEELYKQSQYFTKHLQYQYFSDSLTEFVTILNSNRQIVFCNQPLVTYLNAVDANDIIGKRPGEALHCQHSNITPGGCGTTEFCKMCGAYRAIMQSQQGKENIQECRIISEPDTKALDLSVHATPFTYNNEPFTIFALTDIGDEKRRKVLESLFFHDILNMVGGLLGYSELLKDASAEEAKEFAPIMSKLVSDLSDQITAQKELAKAEHNTTKVSPTMIHAKTFLDSIVLSLRMHAVSKDKTITVDPSAEDFIFVSDDNILHRVIGNLTKNALEATNINSTVQISCKRKGSEVQFSVHNNEEIPYEVQLQIFQRSFSTKGDGRGLGTYSVKLFTEQYLNGEVSFVSNKDDGTTFTVELPISLGTPNNTQSKTSEMVESVFA